MGKENLAAALTAVDERREIIEFDVPTGDPVLNEKGEEVVVDGVVQRGPSVEAYYDGARITTVGFVKLTLLEMERAEERAKNGGAMRLAREMLCEALREVNGKRVSRGNGTADKALSEMGPQLYQMLAGEFSREHTPPEEAIRSFRASRRRKVG